MGNALSRVIVVGGIVMDMYIMLDRLPKVSETLVANGFREVPGGKGLNTAVGASRLGADTMLLGKIGNDSFGRRIGEFLSRQSISLMIYRTNNENTGMAVIQRSPNSETTIAVVYGSNLALKYSEAQRIVFKKGDILIAQLEIPQEITKRLLKKGRDAGAVCILSLTPITGYDKSLKDLADVIIINESELRHFSGCSGKIPNMMKAIRTRQDQAVITTLGANGSMILLGSKIVKIKGKNASSAVIPFSCEIRGYH